MKIQFDRNLFAGPKVSVLTIISFLLVMTCMLCGVLIGWHTHAHLIGDLPRPVDRTNIAHWGRVVLLLCFVLVPVLLGSIVGSFLTMLVAKCVLRIPRVVFEKWLDATNCGVVCLRKWNNMILDRFYKMEDV